MIKIVCAAAAVITLGILLASLFLLIALTVYQTSVLVVSAPAATLLTLVFLLGLLIALVAIAIAFLRYRYKEPAAAPSGKDVLDAFMLQGGRWLADELAAHPMLGATGSLIAGFAIGASPELRRVLGSVLFAQTSRD